MKAQIIRKCDSFIYNNLCQTDSDSAGQETPHQVWNSKFQGVCEATLLISILRQPRAVLDSVGAERSGDRIHLGARFSSSVQTGSGVHTTLYTMDIGFLSREYSCRGVVLTTQLHLATRLKKEQSYAFALPLFLYVLQ
jgi:hypothetical protein